MSPKLAIDPKLAVRILHPPYPECRQTSAGQALIRAFEKKSAHADSKS